MTHDQGQEELTFQDQLAQATDKGFKQGRAEREDARIAAAVYSRENGYKIGKWDGIREERTRLRSYIESIFREAYRQGRFDALPAHCSCFECECRGTRDLNDAWQTWKFAHDAQVALRDRENIRANEEANEAIAAEKARLLAAEENDDGHAGQVPS